MKHPFWILVCLAIVAAIGATEPPQAHRIPARAVRNMLAEQGITNSGYGQLAAAKMAETQAKNEARTAPPQNNCIFTISPTSITVPYTGGSGFITVTAMKGKSTSLILEPLDNGCFSVAVQDADPASLLTVQRSQDLVAWVDAQSLSNSTSYIFTNCFSANTDHLFLRLVTP